jgi:NAD(P)-dependent dehydrogenase (short-subunit alcohol dehydrogenase family)
MNTNLTDKTILITGGTSGIGKHTAIGLAKLGARVIVTGRDQARGQLGVSEIKNASGNNNVHLLLADLSTINRVRQLARDFKTQFDRLDVLVNNAGLLEGQRRQTSDGLEAHFALNVVAPYLLTLQLLPLLQICRGRVVNLNGGLPFGQIDLGNMQAEKSFEGLRTYSHSKMLMTAASLELARRISGTGVTVNVVYPGGASTAMTQAMTPTMLPGFMRPFWAIFSSIMQKQDGGAGAAKAAHSSIIAASSNEFAGKTGLMLGTNGKISKPHASIRDPHNQQAIWQTLEFITGAGLEPNQQVSSSAPLRFA